MIGLDGGERVQLVDAADVVEQPVRGVQDPMTSASDNNPPVVTTLACSNWVSWQLACSGWVNAFGRLMWNRTALFQFKL